MEIERGVGCHWAKARGIGGHGFKDFIRVERGAVVNCAEDDVFIIEHFLEAGAKALGLEQFTDLKADFKVFVGIERRDARFGGAEAFGAEAFFLELVEQNVIGHHQLRPVGDEDFWMDPGCGEGIVFGKKAFEVERYSRSEHVCDMIIADARRQEVEGEAALFVDDGVAGVRAALIADDNIRFGGEKIGHLSFPLVPPVCAHN